MYLTYEEYQDMIGNEGGYNRADFLRLEILAESRIREHTQGRVDKMADVPECVKNLVFVLLPEIETASREVSSVSNDGYSESYRDTAQTEKLIQSTIMACLSGCVDDNGVPLLYRGLDDVQRHCYPL